jgi:WD40 repeat protein
MKKHQYFLLIILSLLSIMNLPAMGGLDLGYVTGISYNADGSRVLVSHGDGAIAIWDTYSTDIVKQFAAHYGGVLSASFSTDGRYILSMGFDAYHKWDSETASLIYSYPFPFDAYNFFCRQWK